MVMLGQWEKQVTHKNNGYNEEAMKTPFMKIIRWNIFSCKLKFYVKHLKIEISMRCEWKEKWWLNISQAEFDGKINIHVDFSLLFLNRTNRNDM